jgi:hypothetical protein
MLQGETKWYTPWKAMSSHSFWKNREKSGGCLFKVDNLRREMLKVEIRIRLSKTIK